jgi:polyisoprenoid-binding protein YceI
MNWKIDPAHTQIEFSVRHMMIAKVRGSFERFDGTVALDETDPEATQVTVAVEAASINTREPNRDNHLRSADFLQAADYPTVDFQSTRVERTGERTAKLHGELTIRGVTRPVTLDVEFLGFAKSPWGTFSAGFAARGKINRKDWNLTWNQALETGGVLVGEEIEITVELELIRQEQNQAEAV